MPTHEAFVVLTEDEHDTIAELWRQKHGSGLPLAGRYDSIRAAVHPRIAARVEDTQLRALEEQVAHAVLAQAIRDNDLQGSIPGALVAAIYYHGGGVVYLESYGRLCFCSAYHTKRPRPSVQQQWVLLAASHSTRLSEIAL